MADKYDIKALSPECYPDVFLDIDTTHEQRTALFRKWLQSDQNKAWRDFAHTAQATFGLDGAIVVQWCGMWLCIEKDGYTHS